MIINPYRFAAGVTLPEPLHWWDLDSIGSGVLDKGSGEWGHLQNGTIASPGGVLTTTDQPDGAGDCIDLTSGVSSLLKNMGQADIAWDGVGNDLTAAFWMKADVWGSNNKLFFWFKSGAEIFDIKLATSISNHIAYGQSDTDGDTITAANVGQSASTATWYHVVCTYDSATSTNAIYVNNVLLDETTDVAMGDLETASTTFSIGSATTGDRFNGKMFSAQIFDTVLDEDERTTLYNSGNGGTYADFYTPSFGTNPTSTNLHAWWKLENTDDADGGTYNLTNNNTVTFTSGYNDNAATYNGSNSLSVADDTNFPTGGQTWACFVKLDTFTGGAILMSKDDVSTNRSVLVYVNPSGNLQFYTSSNGTALSSVVSINEFAVLPIKSWIHVCFVIDTAGTDLLMYIDGKLNNTNTTGLSSVHNGTAACYVGGRSDGLEPTGQIDDACIFDKALSADEVKWLAHNTYADL